MHTIVKAFLFISLTLFSHSSLSTGRNFTYHHRSMHKKNSLQLSSSLRPIPEEYQSQLIRSPIEPINYSPLIKAIMDDNHHEIERLLNSQESCYRSHSFKHLTLLMAVKKGNRATLQLLLSYDGHPYISINGSDNFGTTALVSAIRNNQGALISLLLTHQYTNMRCDRHYCYALVDAIINKNVLFVHLLLEKDPTSANASYIDSLYHIRKTILQKALEGGHFTIIHLILATMESLKSTHSLTRALAAAGNNTALIALLELYKDKGVLRDKSVKIDEITCTLM